MKLSTRGRYGLRAMIDIAGHSAEEAVSMSAVAKRQNISEGYLEQIIARLKKEKLLSSKRGAGGGYTLAKNAKDISVGDILRALEGSLEPVACAGAAESGACASEDACVSKYVWKKINASINQTVDEISLQEVLDLGKPAEAAATKKNPKFC